MKFLSNWKTIKNKFIRMFCKHKNIGTFMKEEKDLSLAGDMYYEICKDCGKEVSNYFAPHD